MRSLVKLQLALVYLDDAIVFLRSPRGYINHWKRILLLLQDAGITIKLKKVNFCTGSTEYFDHVIRP